MSRRARTARLAVVAVLAGGALAFAGASGITFANTPATLHTCTTLSRLGALGGIRVAPTDGTCPPKQLTQTWVDQRYQQIMLDARSPSGEASTSYEDMNLSDLNLPVGGISGSSVGDGIGQFNGANFTNSSLLGEIWNVDNFKGADFDNADLSHGTFNSDDFSDSNLTDANLDGADFTGSDMASVTYSDTTCPNGTSSSSHVVNGQQTCTGQGGGL